MQDIQYRNLSDHGPVEDCRELCNALMAHQTHMARKYPYVFRAMNFETRLKPAFLEAKCRFLMAAYDGNLPIGYVFCDASLLTEQGKLARPRVAGEFIQGGEGLFPGWLPVPVVCSHLNNIYVKPEYRGKGIGARLMEEGLAWAEHVPESRYIFVHVSEGNDVGPLYEKYGFRHSHSVCGGVIEAYVREIPESFAG